MFDKTNILKIENIDISILDYNLIDIYINKKYKKIKTTMIIKTKDK